MSGTIEVVARHEQVLATGRFATDNSGYAAMRKHVVAWPERTWAIEGSNGAGRALALRLLADGEHVVDVPAKLAARVRMLDTGHGRKTDADDAHSVAVAAVRTKELRVLALDPPDNGPHRQNRQTRVCQPCPAIGTHSLGWRLFATSLPLSSPGTGQRRLPKAGPVIRSGHSAAACCACLQVSGANCRVPRRVSHAGCAPSADVRPISDT